MSSQDDTINQCEECKELYTNYTNSYYRWCKQCQLNNLKRILASSENEKLDNFIRDMQSKIDDPSYTIFEWIPYNQFNNIKEISKDRFFTVHSAIWKDGPLYYNYKEYIRNSNKEVVLKCLHNSQNSIELLINEV